MPKGLYNGIRMTQVSQHQARVTVTGLVTAKYIEMYTDNNEPLLESIRKLMDGDADLIAESLLTLLNLFVMFVSENGQNEAMIKDMCDFLIKSLADDTPQITRMMN